MLLHDDDTFVENEFDFETVSQRPPTQQELADLRFAWKACKHVKSNAIVLANGGQMVSAVAGLCWAVLCRMRWAGPDCTACAAWADAGKMMTIWAWRVQAWFVQASLAQQGWCRQG